ncbi:hypothetical protein ACHAW5_000132 [Stephanodiscus triporus]|uniref:Fascin domain-containing protein n=1 Tax=Stephanodiscus triporus TaxID=2934178 RepID=A0ABD3MNL8_9STRA
MARENEASCDAIFVAKRPGQELLFISHPNYDRRLSCNIFGHIWMCGNWKGWEVWRFVKIDDDGTFIITSWTHDRKVLCSDRDGRVFTTENKEGTWEKWKVSLHQKSHGVRIQSVEHGRYLAFSGKDMYTMVKDEDTAWHLEPANLNRFFISSKCHDKRISSSNDHPFTHHNRKGWEKWVIEPTGATIGQFVIRSLKHGKYLVSSGGGKIIVSEFQHYWTICSSPYGGVFLQSVDTGGRLSCNEHGHVCTTDASEGWETFCLEPIMPGTISEKQIWSLVGIGITSIVLAVATPFAVMGAIGAIGFGAEGIAAGSMAAGMMSAEAIASGGGVIAGGTVATLQSVGAVGLGAAGASAAAAAGAAIGGLSSFGVVLAGQGLVNGQNKINLDEYAKHLPLCSWRIWK